MTDQEFIEEAMEHADELLVADPVVRFLAHTAFINGFARALLGMAQGRDGLELTKATEAVRVSLEHAGERLSAAHAKARH